MKYDVRIIYFVQAETDEEAILKVLNTPEKHASFMDVRKSVEVK